MASNQKPSSSSYRSRLNSSSSSVTTNNSSSAYSNGTNSNFTSPSSVHNPTFSPSLNDNPSFPAFPHELIASGSNSVLSSTSNSAPLPSNESLPPEKKSKAPVKRPRQVLSCVPCKSRKIKCDRNVPRCESCVRRGIAHECRWGDERDELLKEPNLGPTNAALLAKNAQLQHQIQKLEAQLAISSTETNPQATSSSSSPSTTANQRSDASQLKIQMLEARIKELESAPSSKSPESSNSTSAAGKRKMLEPSNLEEEREDKVVHEIAEQMGSFWWGLARNESESLVSSPTPSRARSDSVGATPPSTGPTYRSRMVRELISSLPGPMTLDWIADFHFREIEPMDRSIHEPTFRASLSKFKLWLGSNDPNDELPELPFAALMLAICSDVGSVLSREEIRLLGLLPPEYGGDISILLDRWHSASWAILCMSQFFSSPTMEGFQTTIRMKGFAQRLGRWPFFINLASASLRAAEVIGWGQLGTAESDERQWSRDREDEARGVPVVKKGFGYGSHLKREQARRIYWNLRNFEHFLQYRVGFALHVPFATPTATGFPVEIEDDDLVEGMGLPPSSSVQVTFTWLPYTSKVASFAHRIWEASQPHSNYQNIMSVDAEIRNLSDSIPASCKIDPNSPTMEHEEPWKVSQKVALSLWLNSSLLQLHRRYYASGYQRPEYAFSTSACLSSARHIIQLLQTKVGKSTKEAVGVRWSRFWLPDRIFSAASVLLIQLLQPSVSGNEAASLMRDVDRSIDFIQSFVDSEGFVLKNCRMCVVLRSLRLAVIQHRSRDITAIQDFTTFQLPIKPLKSTTTTSNSIPTYTSSYSNSTSGNGGQQQGVTLRPVQLERNNEPMNYVPLGSGGSQYANQHQQHSQRSSNDFNLYSSTNPNNNLSSIQNNPVQPSSSGLEMDFDYQDQYLSTQDQQRMQNDIDRFIATLSPSEDSNLSNGVPFLPILDELLMAPPPPRSHPSPSQVT